MSLTMTLERHILIAQRDFKDATGALTSLLYDLALAAKVIAREATRTNILELQDSPKEPKATSLYKFADATFIQLNQRVNRVGVIATESQESVIENPGGGKYVLMLDPLDGVSPTDYTVSLGTIFGIYRRASSGDEMTMEDYLQTGRHLIVAGYILYGSSTVMVYSSGHGVNGFTLDPGLGEFLLSHENIQIPSPPRYYSLNHAHDDFWSPGSRRFARFLQGKDSTFPGGLSMRYTGSLVADFHRNLLAGGIFVYPDDTIYPYGKMRLTFEANPLAFLAEQAGGAASNGQMPILDVQPSDLHQRTPFFIGNKELVHTAEAFIKLHDINKGNDYR
ncbi:MAG: fructose-1,6-bisphosphatase [Anaerolineales bacterium]|nr:fructose-1,6-bisphosphatase [Anaerolineales bacterium]